MHIDSYDQYLVFVQSSFIYYSFPPFFLKSWLKNSKKDKNYCSNKKLVEMWNVNVSYLKKYDWINLSI